MWGGNFVLAVPIVNVRKMVAAICLHSELSEQNGNSALLHDLSRYCISDGGCECYTRLFSTENKPDFERFTTFGRIFGLGCDRNLVEDTDTDLNPNRGGDDG